MIRAFEAVQRGCFLLLAAFLLLTVIRVPGAVSLAWAALAVLSAAAPFEGLLIVAAFVPIGVAIGSLAGTPPGPNRWSSPSLRVPRRAPRSAPPGVMDRPVGGDRARARGVLFGDRGARPDAGPDGP